jgi:hypothetical protein
MKKAILIIFLLILSRSAKCDVIYFPYPFTGPCYSAELIYSIENFKKDKNTTNYCAGFGFVGSMIFTSEKPTFGLEVAIERRHYFRPEKYKHFFVSAYLGGAFMTDFGSFSSIGLVPGVKINYKANVITNLVLEPYFGFSVPITYELTKYRETLAFPALTFGVRLGFNKLNDRRLKIENNAI